MSTAAWNFQCWGCTCFNAQSCLDCTPQPETLWIDIPALTNGTCPDCADHAATHAITASEVTACSWAGYHGWSNFDLPSCWHYTEEPGQPGIALLIYTTGNGNCRIQLDYGGTGLPGACNKLHRYEKLLTKYSDPFDHVLDFVSEATTPAWCVGLYGESCTAAGTTVHVYE